MTIIENVVVRPDLERLLRALGGNHAKMKDDARWAVDAIEGAARPKAVVNLFALEIVSSRQVRIVVDDGEPAILNVGEKGTQLLSAARRVQVGVVTLGAELEHLGDEQKKRGQIIRQYVLDVAAVLALDQLGQEVNRLAEKKAAESEWGVSYRLSPGDVQDWPMTDQRVLASLLPIDAIGVTIMASGMLSPLKSAAGLIGLGPGYTSNRVKLVCKWCRHQKQCPIRLSEPRMS